MRKRPFLVRQTALSSAVGIVAGVVFGPSIDTVVFVTAWLAIGLTVGFGQTLATDAQARVVGPLGVLARERRVSRLAAWTLFPLLAIGFSTSWGLLWGTLAAAAYCGTVGEIVACALWRRYLANDHRIRVSSRPASPTSVTPAGAPQAAHRSAGTHRCGSPGPCARRSPSASHAREARPATYVALPSRGDSFRVILPSIKPVALQGVRTSGTP